MANSVDLAIGPFDGGTTIAMILIASFVVDRLVSALMFLLSSNANDPPQTEQPGSIKDSPQRPAGGLRWVANCAADSGKKSYRVMYFVIASLFVIPVLFIFGEYRVLSAMGVASGGANQWAYHVLDTVVTGIVLLGGADVFGTLKKTLGAAQTELESRRPIEVQGTLDLRDEGRKRVDEESAAAGE